MSSPPLAHRLAALLTGALLTLSTAAQATGPHFHTVVNGDTLWSIAQRYHLTAPELADRNHLAPPFVLRRGMRLRLPSRAVIPADAPTPAPHPPPATRPLPSPPSAHPNNPNHRPGSRWGRPARPGVVHLVRLADHESITLDLRRIGPVTRQRARQFLRSSSGETHPIDPRLLRQLALFSDHFGGRTLEVVSGFRPRRRRQWTAHSKHNTGHAIDFRIVGVPNRLARDFCRTLPATGCGFYPRSVFIHMDTRDESAYWVDWSRPGERPRYGSESHPPPEPHRPHGAHPAASPDPSVPPVGAEVELDDVADDTPVVRTAPPSDPDTPAPHDERAPGAGGPAPSPRAPAP